MGVFDGVGGWSNLGIDAGLYSKQLATLTAAHISKHGPASVVDALKEATKNNSAMGSSTACVVGIDGNRLVGVNLGDSGLLVIRGRNIVFRTHDQQHYFNCPYQIGTDSSDTVDAGAPIDFELLPGDCVVLGTDGLWDNVFPKQVIDIVSEYGDLDMANGCATSSSSTSSTIAAMAESKGQVDDSMRDDADESSMISECTTGEDREKNALMIVVVLADTAIKVAGDRHAQSPFAVNAQGAGHNFIGGKVDDITIIAAFVVEGSSCGGRRTNIVNGKGKNNASGDDEAEEVSSKIYAGPS